MTSKAKLRRLHPLLPYMAADHSGHAVWICCPVLDLEWNVSKNKNNRGGCCSTFDTILFNSIQKNGCEPFCLVTMTSREPGLRCWAGGEFLIRSTLRLWRFWLWRVEKVTLAGWEAGKLLQGLETKHRWIKLAIVLLSRDVCQNRSKNCLVFGDMLTTYRDFILLVD